MSQDLWADMTVKKYNIFVLVCRTALFFYCQDNLAYRFDIFSLGMKFYVASILNHLLFITLQCYKGGPSGGLSDSLVKNGKINVYLNNT